MRHILSVLIVASCVLADVRAAHAQLLQNLNVTLNLIAQHRAPPLTSQSGAITGTAAPIRQTLTENDGEGGTVTGQYSLTDNGQVATININCSAAITDYNNQIEAQESDSANSFFLSQPAHYTATVSETGPGTSFLAIIGDFIYVNTQVQNESQTFSGITSPGDVSFGSTFVIPNSFEYNNLSGSESISVTFTAIPEPSSAMLIGLSAPALLGRRPRPARRRIACRGTRKR